MERVSHGAGLMVVTNKHLYYHGAKAFRIPFSKIVSYEPFSNGIGITRDAANAKMQTFVTDRGLPESLRKIAQECGVAVIEALDTAAHPS